MTSVAPSWVFRVFGHFPSGAPGAPGMPGAGWAGGGGGVVTSGATGVLRVPVESGLCAGATVTIVVSGQIAKNARRTHPLVCVMTKTP
ncbi:MAG TPA: hypothetical protein VE910_01330, partial [Dongiaceae bacterium]|nr:hypothetical protein [Dongiaceae bacterium]